jgi:hypothetical protein
LLKEIGKTHWHQFVPLGKVKHPHWIIIPFGSFVYPGVVFEHTPITAESKDPESIIVFPSAPVIKMFPVAERVYPATFPSAADIACSIPSSILFIAAAVNGVPESVIESGSLIRIT